MVPLASRRRPGQPGTGRSLLVPALGPAASILCLVLTVDADATTIVNVKGGLTETPLGELLKDRPDVKPPKGEKFKWSYSFLGVNLTGQRIKDFELELKGCGDEAKFHYIKVYAKADFGTGDLSPRSDWDVDDDRSGLSDQRRTPGGNETDNVDETPESRARVDANGAAYIGCCTGAASDASQSSESGTEDGDESRPGDAAPGTNEQPASDTDLGGNGGVQPGDEFAIFVELTAEPTGEHCALALAPSGAGGEPIPPKDAAPPAPPPAPSDNPPAGSGQGTPPQQPQGTPPAGPAEPAAPPGHSMLPSACPGGERGMLAGTINSLLGTNLAATCEDDSPGPGGSKRYGGRSWSGGGSGSDHDSEGRD